MRAHGWYVKVHFSFQPRNIQQEQGVLIIYLLCVSVGVDVRLVREGGLWEEDIEFVEMLIYCMLLMIWFYGFWKCFLTEIICTFVQVYRLQPNYYMSCSGYTVFIWSKRSQCLRQRHEDSKTIWRYACCRRGNRGTSPWLGSDPKPCCVRELNSYWYTEHH